MKKTHDFFISYKWTKHAIEANQVKQIASDRGYKVWIDTENPFIQDVLSNNDQSYAAGLARHLKEGLDSAEYVIFFEAVASMQMVVNGPPKRKKSWHEKELEMRGINNIIILHHTSTPRWIRFGKNEKLHSYSDLEEAFSLIEKAIASPDTYFIKNAGEGR